MESLTYLEAMPNVAESLRSIFERFDQTSKPETYTLIDFSLDNAFNVEDIYNAKSQVFVTLSFDKSTKKKQKSLCYIQKDKSDSGFCLTYFYDAQDEENIIEVLSVKIIAFDEFFEIPADSKYDVIINSKVSKVAKYMKDFNFSSSDLTDEEIHECINPSLNTEE